VGVLGCFTANPDLDVLVHGIERDVTDLVKAARRHHRSAAAKRRD
jgi:hypothetical protein